MRLIFFTEDTLEQRRKWAEEFGSQRVESGIEVIDNAFDGLYKGSLYAVCAARGVGKSTFLLASAKKIAEQGSKTLYLTVEQSFEQLMGYIPEIIPNFVLLEFNGEAKAWGEIKEVIKEHKIEYVFFDYIGANLTNWDDLVREANMLAEVAKELGIIIFTASQADDALFEEFNNNPKSAKLNTGCFVSFSKHIMDKVAGGAYLVRANGTTYMYCFKNRYGALNYSQIRVDGLDYSTKSWNSPWNYFHR